MAHVVSDWARTGACRAAALTIGATRYPAAVDSTDEPAQTCPTDTPPEGGWTCYAPDQP